MTNNTVPGSLEDAPEGLPRDPNRQPPKRIQERFLRAGLVGVAPERIVALRPRRGRPCFREPSLARHVPYDIVLRSGAWQPGWFPPRWPRRQLQPREQLGSPKRPPTTGHPAGRFGACPSMVARYHKVVIIWSAACSGINWHALFTTVKAQHGTRAREIGAAFAWKSGTDPEAAAIATNVHECPTPS